jgi:glutathione S-transferase
VSSGGRGATPKLWQYNFSNYNEKARWALDYKGIAHRRRSLMPGEPRAMAFSLRGTLPVLDIGGERYADSTDIIAALERIEPEPALYPSDPELRTRALEIEDRFDEEVGHALRRALFWEVREDREYMRAFITHGQPAALKAMMRATFPLGWLYVSHRYTFTEADAAAAWGTLESALADVERERAGRDYLVGDSFSVADLTAAALLWPLAWPEQFPYELPEPRYVDRFEQLRSLPGVDWVRATYARHRGTSAEVAG